MTAKIANSITVFCLLAALYAFAVAALPYVLPHANPVVQAHRLAVSIPVRGLMASDSLRRRYEAQRGNRGVTWLSLGPLGRSFFVFSPTQRGNVGANRTRRARPPGG